MLHMHNIWLKSGRFERTPLPFANRLELCLQTSRPHSVGYGECGREVCTRISQRLANGRGVRPCPTAVCGTAAGTRRSPVGTLNMGTWAGAGEALAWDIASDVPSTSPGHMTNSGAHSIITIRTDPTSPSAREATDSGLSLTVRLPSSEPPCPHVELA